MTIKEVWGRLKIKLARVSRSREVSNLGSYGEKLASEFLRKKGFRLVEKNFRTPRWGEIDLVMRDGDTLVFVEVKTRSESSAVVYGGPLGAIHPHKLEALKRAAQFYLSSKKLDREAARIDAVSVVISPETEPAIEHFLNIA